jgi:hypothetical protein
MSWTRAAVYWLVALALAAIYVGGEDAVRTASAPSATPTPLADRTEVPLPLKRIEVRRDDVVIAWERRPEGAWTVVEPAGTSIPAGLLDAFAEQVATISAGEHFDGDADDPAFGLERPGLRIALVGEDGRTLALVVGERTPTGTAAYARREGGGPVLLVGLNLLYYSDLLFDAAR